MIVTPMDGRLRVVTQNDHAHFAGELLALWRSGGMPVHPRRQELLFAAREHDNGWRELDSAPMCDPGSGRPVDFTAVRREMRWQVWRQGTWRYVEREPYAALLIVRHALHLHRAHHSDPEWSDEIAWWRQLESELTVTTGAAEAQIADDYRWIEITDLLSLAACKRWRSVGPSPEEPHGLEAHGVRAVLRAGSGKDDLTDNLFVEPFPLAGVTTFRVACRWIPDRRYAGDADLGTELATARWREHAVRVQPGGDILDGEQRPDAGQGPRN